MDDQSGMKQPEPDAATKELVSQWCGKITSAKAFWDTDFKRFREDMEVARLGADGAWVDGGNYTVPVVQRHINQAVATLYAKNPTAVYERRKRLQFKIWDGSEESLQAAYTQVQAAAGTMDAATGQPMQPDPASLELIQEVQQVKAQNLMLDRVGKTLEILWDYYNDEQDANFKKLMKQAVRRAKVVGTAYLWLDYQRLYASRPDLDARITDAADKIARIERQMAEAQDGTIEDGTAELAELQASLADLQAQQQVIAREGPIRDFPRVTEIILDPAVKQINGLTGCNWIARESHLTCAEVKQAFKVDIGDNFTPYRESADGKPNRDSVGGERARTGDEKSKACVWRVYDKATQMTFVVAEGYPDFIEPPAAPQVKLSRFWPLFVLTLNDVESEKAVFPPGDVRMLKHPQQEYNRARQSLREHRIANRPGYVTPTGRVTDEEEKKITGRQAHDVVHVSALAAGEKPGDLIAALPMAPIDPALYDTQPMTQDILLSVGSQLANLGPTGGATATESSIAQQSSDTVESSNTDDIDMFLSELAAAQAEMLLLNLQPETAIKIAGPGAVWPSLDRQTLAESVTLTVRAGSSGRPNAAAELAKLERAMPSIVQLPGINPKPIAHKYADLLGIDVEELILDALPSIVAQNSLAGKPAPMGNDPNAQGGQGGDNAKKPQQNEPGGQPAYPSGNPLGVIRYDATGARAA